MKTQTTFMLLICMVMTAGSVRNLNEASPQQNHHQQDVLYSGWRGPWPWFRRPFYPFPPYSPPTPVDNKPPPSSSEPRPSSGDFNDPGKCTTALNTNCVGDLISYVFRTSNSIGQPCCNRIKQLSKPCFAQAFMDEPSYYNRVIKYCS